MKHLLLIGGGHAHVEVLRRFARAPLAGVALTLIDAQERLTYSGMLPGFVAGHYVERELHIDLAPLAAAAGCRFITARMTALDATERRVILGAAQVLDYDLLSIDIGAVPAAGDIPGVREHAIAVKPFDAFLEGWEQLLARATRGVVHSVVVVGGGAAGVELLLAMQRRLRAQPIRFRLLTDAAQLLPGHNEHARRLFSRVLMERSVRVDCAARVVRVAQGCLHTADRTTIAADAIVWATGAGAPALIAASGLAVDAQGFIAVDERLQSISHPGVFAAGDIASMVGHPRPKSGVYAVRQGPPLAANLAAVWGGHALVSYVPQPLALALISTGSRHAVASRGRWAAEGAWVWHWKDWLDRRFIARYRLPQ